MYNIVIRAKHFKHAVFNNRNNCALANAIKEHFDYPHYVNENIDHTVVKGIHTVVFKHEPYTSKNFNIDRIIAKIFNFFGRNSMPVRTITLTPASNGFQWKALDGNFYLIHDGRLTWIPDNRVLNKKNLKQFGYATHMTDVPPSAKTEQEVHYYNQVAQVYY